MKVKKLLLTLGVCASLSVAAQSTADMDRFIDDLMSRMTLHEKIGQLNLQVAGDITTGQAQDTQVGGRIRAGEMGGVFNLKGADKIRELQRLAVEETRLGIPMIVGMDVIHGYETIFPIPLGLSCSWNMDAVETSARIAAKECSADGINWVYSPMVDISVDPRWGRVSEGNGEDPYLSGEIARAMVRGYQGDNYKLSSNVMACLKHYALYGASEAGRDYNTVDMSHLRMYNQFFPPYRAAVDEGVGSVMSSFNVVDGIPATANPWLLNHVLREQWKFDGFLVTDYGSIGEMLSHGTGATIQECSARALQAGTDMDMCTQGYVNTLEQSVAEGRVSEAEIDLACRRVLEAKWKLGLFADPYKYCDATRRAKDIFTAENRAAAREIAAQTFVLLKNQDNLLPLRRDQKIALIGPLANNRANMAGTWVVAFTPERYSTLKEGFERAMNGRGELLYAQGSNIYRDEATQRAAEFGKNIERGDDEAMKAEALAVAAQADVIVCAMGECADMTGESSSRADISLPDVQRELLAELVKLGKPVVLLNFSGRPTLLNWEKDNVDAILNVWFGGSEAADAIADVVFGDVSPSGKLTMTFPQSVGQIPLYYNHLNTGRPVQDGADRYFKYAGNYLDVRNDPLYPFGYGMSYTTFAYGDMSINSKDLNYETLSNGRTVAKVGDRKIDVAVEVENTGNMDADEIVQLYIRDLDGMISRPVKELKGFKRIHLAKGEKQLVSFTLTEDDLSYYDGEGNMVFEPGLFDIMIGPDSKNLQTIRVEVK